MQDYTDLDLSYINGFVTKCAELGIDAESLIRKSAADDAMMSGDIPSDSQTGDDDTASAIENSKSKGGYIDILKRTATGALGGGAVGGIVGGASGVDSLTSSDTKADWVKLVLRAALKGAGRGSLVGGAAGLTSAVSNPR